MENKDSINDMVSVKSLCESIWQFEECSNILACPGKAKYWTMMRMAFYYYSSELFGIFSKAHPHTRGWKWMLTMLVRLIHNQLINLLKLSNLYNSKVLVFEHYRDFNYQGVVVDTYSYGECNALIESDTPFLVLSKTYDGKCRKTDCFKRFNIDGIEVLRKGLSLLLYRFVPKSYIQYEISVLEEVFLHNSVLSDYFNVQFRRGVIEYWVTYYCYFLLFTMAHNCKKILLVDGYSYRAGLIRAAKDKGMKVTELQHGVLTKYHMGYSYPVASECSAYRPDAITVWNTSWASLLSKFSCISDIMLRPNPVLSALYNQSSELLSVGEKSVLIISQGALSVELPKFLLHNIECFDSFNIFYKLHPSEFSQAISRELMELNNKPNFSILYDVNIYEYINSVNHVLGCFSTAVFESINLGKSVFILPISGSEYFEGFEEIKWFTDWKELHEK